MKHFALLLTLTVTSIAGDLNIIQLGTADAVSIEISCDGIIQNVELPHGNSTGRFMLPAKEATIRITNCETPALTIPATATSNIAVLVADTKGYRWTLIPGNPTDEMWSLRAINLTSEPAKLIGKDGLLEIKSGGTSALPVSGKGSMAIRFENGGKFPYDGSEPCAVVALIHRKDDAWQVLFVPDR